MTEQEEKVLKLCRYWYQTASDISRQTLWYEIGVLLENERGLTKRAVDLPCTCGLSNDDFHPQSWHTADCPKSANH